MKSVYQYLYENTDYGQAEKNNCPGVKYFKYYKDHLLGSIFDVGCGNGDTINMLCENGFPCDGMDFIDLGNELQVGDISKKIKDIKDYETSICIDVFEHLTDKQVKGVLKNMAKTVNQVITVHNKRAVFKGSNGEQLHINLKEFDKWEKIISKYLEIKERFLITPYLVLYLCQK